MANKKERSEIELIINTNVATRSLKSLRSELIGAERVMSNMAKDDDPAAWKAQAKNVQILKASVAQMRAEIAGTEGSLKKFSVSWKDIATGIVGGAGALYAFNMAKTAIYDTIAGAGKLDDAFSDIAKTTNLTADQVKVLNSELQELNTRTGMEELRGLAEEAGRLGYNSVEDVMAFVKAADMINVALGDTLGEGATKDIAKLSSIFKLDELYGVQDAMLKIGSSINSVGMISTANEGYMVDFMKRMSGISGIAKITAPELIGLAGTLDSMGQSVEVSGTALSKMMVKMGEEVENYARMAKVPVEEFREMMGRSAMEAFTKLLEEVGKTEGGIEELAATLGDLGLDGGRVVGVLGTLAKNTDELKRQTDAANKAFDEGTSIINEFNLKNNNAAAILEKVSKRLSNIWENIQQGFIPAIGLFGRLIGAVDDLDEKVGELAQSQNELAATQEKLPALIKRYEELQGKTEKTAEEQEELRKVMAAIAEISPTAATQFDAYGNVIAINTERADEFITKQKEMLRLMKEETEESLKAANQQKMLRAQEIQSALNSGSITTRVNLGMGQYRDQTKTLQAADVKALRDELTKLNQDMDKNVRAMNLINGVAEKPAPGTAPAPSGGDSPTTPTGPTKPTDEQKKALEDLNKKLADMRQRNHLDTLDGYEKEIAATHYKYEELRKLAKGNSKAMNEIREQEASEQERISDKYNKKYLDGFDKLMRSKLQGGNAETKERQETERKHQDDLLKMQGDERAEIDRHYTKLLTQAEMYGWDTTVIYQMWATQLTSLKNKTMAEEFKLVQENNKKKGADNKRLQAEARQALQEELRNYKIIEGAFFDVSGAISDILSVSAQNSEDFAEFQKAIALFQIAVETGTAVATAITKATASSATVWDMIAGIGAGIAAVTTSFVKAKALINEAGSVPSAPAFYADGGSTSLAAMHKNKSGDPQGWVNQPTLFALGNRSYVAGEAGQEYVISNAMLQNPVVANFVDAAEALRQGRYFEHGGSTVAAPGRPASYSDPQIARTNYLLEKLLAKQPSTWNYSALEEYEKLLNNVRDRARA